MDNEIKGYKVFNPNWTSTDSFSPEGVKYEVGEIYEIDESPFVGHAGYLFYKRAEDCFHYENDFDSSNKIAEIIALGNIHEHYNLYSTNKIKIIKEITWEEFMEIANIGKGNVGYNNIGKGNVGYNNIGNHNQGNYNIGSYNIGEYNIGDYNTGDYNSGSCNFGDNNSGYYNFGDHNFGDNNNGYYNFGSNNIGCWNSGDFNIGDSNPGSWNKGNYNSGDFNITDNNVGCFCTRTYRDMRFFDKKTDITLKEWRNSKSKAYKILERIRFCPTMWKWKEDMTEKEIEKYSKFHDFKMARGHLQSNDTSTAFDDWWEYLDEDEKNIIKSIPNFDADKFYKITGIKV